jgi:putative sterol carrier protein
MADVYPLLSRLRDRFSEPAIQESFKGFTKKILFDFTDTKEQYLISVEDGKTATLEKVAAGAGDVVVTTTTDILSGIINKTVNPVTSYVMRKLKVKGSMEDLMKLQKLMM